VPALVLFCFGCVLFEDTGTNPTLKKVVGTYVLESIRGNTLPYRFFETETEWWEARTGSLVLRDDFSFEERTSGQMWASTGGEDGFSLTTEGTFDFGRSHVIFHSEDGYHRAARWDNRSIHLDGWIYVLQ
jgi:hypothetical protein